VKEDTKDDTSLHPPEPGSPLHHSDDEAEGDDPEMGHAQEQEEQEEEEELPPRKIAKPNPSG
jgi:hypothetical protein